MRDPRAIISSEAVLHESVEVGPFAIIEPGVTIGAGSRIWPHAYICSGTTLGLNNMVHMGVVLGHEPQDLGYGGAPTRLVIGDRNVFREGSQVHRGTKGGTETAIANDCYLMTNAHVAHNCRLGDHVILATGAALGGYAEVGSRAFIGGNAVVHQHTRVGRLAMLQGVAAVSRDVPPFCIAAGVNTVRGVNVVALRRAGFSAKQLAAVRRAFRALFLRRQNLRLAQSRLLAAEAEAGGVLPEVQELLSYIAASTRGVCFGPRGASERGEAREIG